MRCRRHVDQCFTIWTTVSNVEWGTHLPFAWREPANNGVCCVQAACALIAPIAHALLIAVDAMST